MRAGLVDFIFWFPFACEWMRRARAGAGLSIRGVLLPAGRKTAARSLKQPGGLSFFGGPYDGPSLCGLLGYMPKW
jgi:hypothetical protein